MAELTSRFILSLIDFVMVNYYKILKVSPKATMTEIKSAYRRLARKMHPDVNNNSENAAKDFAVIAKAYEILSNPQERAHYDAKLHRNNSNGSMHSTNSVFHSNNEHAQRLRQMAFEHRYNEIIDRMMEAERRETLALQKVIFPAVALFVSTCFVGIFKPMIWTNSQIVGKIVLFTLFIIGVLHLIKRIRSGFERYTYDAEGLHDSIFDDNAPDSKPYTRFAGIAFLFLGTGLSLGIGLLVGSVLKMPIESLIPSFYSRNLLPEFVFYPPIVVLLVDAMHTLVAKFEC